MITTTITVESSAAPGVAPGTVLPAGPAGPSAYDIAVTNGYVGSEVSWLASLQGPAADTRALDAATSTAISAATSAAASAGAVAASAADAKLSAGSALASATAASQSRADALAAAQGAAALAATAATQAAAPLVASATQQAAAASTSASAAAGSAAAAASSASAAAISKNWASQPNGTVDGIYASARSYALQAAAAAASISSGPVTSVDGLTGVVLTEPMRASPVFPTVDLRLTAADCLPAGWFGRLSSGNRTTSAGLLAPVAAGGLRIDHDAATGAPLGALFEEQRTNLLLYSQAFDNATWSANALVVSADSVVAPDGTLTADRITSTGPDGYASQPVTLPAGPFTISLWCKSPDAGRLVNVVVQAGGIKLATLKPALSASWQRYVVSGTNPTAQSATVYLGGDGTLPNGAILNCWAIQLEGGPFATSYLPTLGAQSTRAPDSLVVPVTSDWFNPSEGTFFLDARTPLATSGQQLILGLGQDFTNYIYLEYAAQVVRVRQSSPSGEIGSILLGGKPPGTDTRVAISYGFGMTMGAADGQPTVSTPNVPALDGITKLSVGAGPSGYAPWNAQIRRAAYIPRAVTSAQLQAMTA